MIVSLSLVQGEADIIEYCVRVNLRFLDHMFIVLNPSRDGTSEILDELIREGLPITVIRTARNHYAQSAIMSWFANRIRDQFNPALLCFLDADEVILAKDRESFAESFEGIPPGHVGAIPWRTFLPPRNISKLGFEPSEWSCIPLNEKHMVKVVLPRLAESLTDVIIASGQHSARIGSAVLPSVIMDGVSLGHFPVRSIEQIATKTLASIISKSAAIGGAWVDRGMSYHRHTVLAYLESVADPDIRVIAANYSARSWKVNNSAASTTSLQAPECKLRYQSLTVRRAAQFDLFWRAHDSLIATPDPTEGLEKCKDMVENQTAREGLADGFARAESIDRSCDWPPFEYLLRRFQPASVYQVGCGYGSYLKLFRSNGVEARGADSIDYCQRHFIGSTEYRTVDLNSDSVPEQPFSSVSICVDLADRISPQANRALIQELCAKTDLAIVFSGRNDASGGATTGDLRECNHWLGIFALNNWYVDVTGTLSMRFNATLPRYRRQLFLLTKGPTPVQARLLPLIRQSTQINSHADNQCPDVVVGFLGQVPAFTIDGSRRIQRMPCYQPLRGHSRLP